MDRAFAARTICSRSTSSSTCAACMATARSRTRCGAKPSTRRAGRSVLPRRWWKRPGRPQSGLGLFGGIKTEQGRIDLKKHGLFGIVTAARALAICHHVRRTRDAGAADRAQGMELGGDRDLEALIEAQATFLHFILAQQIEDIEQGRPAEQCRAVKPLSVRDRERLRSALAAVAPVGELTRELCSDPVRRWLMPANASGSVRDREAFGCVAAQKRARRRHLDQRDQPVGRLQDRCALRDLGVCGRWSLRSFSARLADGCVRAIFMWRSSRSSSVRPARSRSS